MIKNILSKMFGTKNENTIDTKKSDERETTKKPVAVESEVPKKKAGYRAEVKEKYGFSLPASDTDKIKLGKKFEKEVEFEKACACYEGCIKNRFDGNGPYDRLIILYKKLDRPEDVLRILKKAISIFDKVAKQGRSDGIKKLEKYKAQFEKITGK